MTYSATATSNAIRYLVKIAGVDKYFATFSGTYNDGGTHGSLDVVGSLGDVAYSGGALDPKTNSVTPSTLNFTLQDSAYLRNLFSRRDNEQFSESALALATTALDVDTITGYAGNYFHVGRECCYCSTASGSSLTLITRNRLGTRNETHPIGSPVSLTPRHWSGRRCWLVLGQHDGVEWQYQDPYKTYFLEGSPSFVDGRWRLSASNGLNFFDRPFYTGFNDAALVDVGVNYSANGGFYYFYPDSMRSFLEPTSTLKAGIWIEAGSKKYLFEIYDFAASYVIVKADSTSQIGEPVTCADVAQWLCGVIPRAATGCPPTTRTMVKEVFSSMYNASADSRPDQVALTVMLSNLGDGTESSDYDTLSGLVSTTQDTLIRAGAGLEADDVDVTSWENAGRIHEPCVGFIVGGGGQESLISFLTTDVAPLLGGYVYVSDAGKLSFMKYAPATTATSADIVLTDSNTIESDSAIDDERPLISSIKIYSPYDWTLKEFTGQHVAHFQAQAHTFKETANILEIKSRMSSSNFNSDMSAFYRYFERWGQGARTYQCQTAWNGHLIEAGDVAYFTNSRMPNFAGSLGVTSQVCEVTGTKIDFARRTVELTLITRPTCKFIAPVVTLGTNVSGNRWNITGSLWDGFGHATEYQTTWRVIFVNPTTGSKRTTTYAYATISAVDGTTMTFTNPPADIAQGDLILFDDFANVGGVTSTNSAVTATQTDYAFISDSDGPNPTGSRHRWG